MLEYETNSTALIGVKIGSNVIYNVLDNEGEFIHTGLSIINYLKKDKNGFVSKITESQSYNGIKYIFDDTIIFNEEYEKLNTNIEEYFQLSSKVKLEFDNVYIYDYINDVLIVLCDDEYVALDYKNEQDVRKFTKTNL